MASKSYELAGQSYKYPLRATVPHLDKPAKNRNLLFDWDRRYRQNVGKIT